MPLTKMQIAKRIAEECHDGFYVDLGIGIPTLVANFIPPEKTVIFQSENGLLGMGPYPSEEECDPDLINAGKQTITAIPGAAYFHSADSFAMIRGGHLDLTVLGAFQVDQSGNIASWMIPGQLVKGMGGAMDLVASQTRIICAMMHRDHENRSKLLPQCTLPLTGKACIDLLVTDLGVFKIEKSAFHLLERAADVSIETIQSATLGNCVISETVRTIPID